MRIVDSLNDQQRRMLAALEEAEEEYLSTLVNMVTDCTGISAEAKLAISELRQLSEFGLVEFATNRNSENKRLIVHARLEALELLDNVFHQLAWSSPDNCWTWDSEKPRLVVLLTEQGVAISRQILESGGWGMTGPA